MLDGTNHAYESDLARRSQSLLLNEAYFNQLKVQLSKSNDILYVDKSLLPNKAGNTSVRNATQNIITFNKSINESYNDAALTFVYQTPKPPQYMAVVEANQPEFFLEGMDQVVFEITSDKVASKVNEVKNNYPHGFIYPDARLNEPISLTFPVYTNFLGYDELTHLGDVDIRLLFDYPSELVNIKEKVLRQLGLGIAPPIPPSVSQDHIDKKVQEWEIFWEGTDKNSTIKLISLKHYPVPSDFTGCSSIPIKRDVNYSGNVSSRLIFDFTINTSDLADMISSPELRNRISSPKMESLPKIPTHSELELRIPDALQLCDSVPSRFLDLEYRLLMALGIPKSDLPSIDPGSFSITAVDFII